MTIEERKTELHQNWYSLKELWEDPSIELNAVDFSLKRAEMVLNYVEAVGWDRAISDLTVGPEAADFDD